MFFLFKITKAAITPGTQPHMVRIKTIKIEPQPLSNTERGGNKIDKITLVMDILNYIKSKIQILTAQ